MRQAPDRRPPDERLEFGVVILDKPAGPTSHHVSTWVQALTGQSRAGHIGTLDPGVTGCLPVVLGDAARLTDVLTGGKKGYVAILELHDDPPGELAERLSAFEGPIYQRPPRKSAVKRTIRTRTIHALDVLERDDRRLLIRVECEAGTYIRKLCHDLGVALGTGGHMAALRRIESQPFDDSELTTLHDLADAIAFWREDGETAPIDQVVHPAERALEHLPTITISESTATSVADGAPVFAPGVIEGPHPLEADSEYGTAPQVVCATPNGSAVCIGRLVGDPTADSGRVVDLERVLV